jgi:hypothetical protein
MNMVWDRARAMRLSWDASKVHIVVIALSCSQPRAFLPVLIRVVTNTLGGYMPPSLSRWCSHFSHAFP